MTIKNIIRSVVQLLARLHPFAARRNPEPLPPPTQLALDLDQLTDSGLPLREALPVRSAEYWLQLGKPDLALQELQTLPETVRHHHWPLRVRLAATLQLAHAS